jgi:hypothetical protein
MWLIMLIIGILIGWNVFPQPVWVKRLWDKAVNKIKGGTA